MHRPLISWLIDRHRGRIGMKFIKSLAAALITSGMLLAAPLAHAHAKLAQSTPGAGAAVNEAPSQLELLFSTPLHLTYLALTPHAGEAVKLDLPRSEPKKAHTLPLPTLSPSHYTVEWRAMSADGHVMKDDWQFEITGK
jgi:methionine-rich copper-binding protein CopC